MRYESRDVTASEKIFHHQSFHIFFSEKIVSISREKREVASADWLVSRGSVLAVSVSTGV